MDTVIISLTTITSRIDKVYATLKSVLQQTTSYPYSVVLNLSREEYLIDRGISTVPYEIKELEHTHSSFHIRWVENLGPYRKIIPILQDYINTDYDPIIITIDDDTIYPNSFLETLLCIHKVHKCIVAYRGYTMSIKGGAFSEYAEWQANKVSVLSVLNLPTGKDGILYKKSYFHSRVVDIARFKKVAPFADDLWLKWHTAINHIPVYIINNSLQYEFPSNTEIDFEKSLWEKYNKTGGNNLTIQSLEKYFFFNLNTTLARTLSLDSDDCSNFSQCQYTLEAILGNDFDVVDNYIANNKVDLENFLFSNQINTPETTARVLFQNLNSIKVYADKLKEKIVTIDDFDNNSGGFLYTNQLVSQFNLAYGNLLKTLLHSHSILVSIIVMTYNSSATIESSIESLLSQDYANIEIIIVDDKSTDGTFELIETLARRDSRIRYVQLQRNRGTYFCKNIGLKVSTGHYVTFHDSDDYSHPSRIKYQLWRIQMTNKKATRCAYVRHDSKLGRVVRVNGKLSSIGYVTLFFHKNIIDKIGYFDCSRKCADDEFISRLFMFFGDDSIDDFGLPLYVALFQSDSLISDSIEMYAESNITFSLSNARKQYRDSYEKFHLNLASSGRLNLRNIFKFPPDDIFIPKDDSLKSFDLSEIKILQKEVQSAVNSLKQHF